MKLPWSKKNNLYTKYSAPITNGILRNGKGPSAPRLNAGLRVRFAVRRTGSSQIPLTAINSMTGRDRRSSRLPKEEHPRRRRLSDDSAGNDERSGRGRNDDERRPRKDESAVRISRMEQRGSDRNLSSVASGRSMDSDRHGHRPREHRGAVALASSEASASTSDSAAWIRRERRVSDADLSSVASGGSAVSGGCTDTERSRRARERRRLGLASSVPSAGFSGSAPWARLERSSSHHNLSSVVSGGSSDNKTYRRPREPRRLGLSSSTHSAGSSGSAPRARLEHSSSLIDLSSGKEGLRKPSSDITQCHSGPPARTRRERMSSDATDLSSVISGASTDSEKHRRAKERRKRAVDPSPSAATNSSVGSSNANEQKLLASSIISEVSEGSSGTKVSEHSSDTLVSLENSQRKLGDLPERVLSSYPKWESNSTVETAEISDISEDQPLQRQLSSLLNEKIEAKNSDKAIVKRPQPIRKLNDGKIETKTPNIDKDPMDSHGKLSLLLDEKIEAKMRRKRRESKCS